jgi:hypothetical protein
LTSNGKAIEGIIVDNCCSLQAKLKNIFGENSIIKLDFSTPFRELLHRFQSVELMQHFERHKKL